MTTNSSDEDPSVATARTDSPGTTRLPQTALAGIVFVGGASLYLGPAMGWRLDGVLGPDHGDPLLYVYLLKWFAHSLATAGVGSYWDAPFFHPLPGVVAYSDHLVGPGLAFVALSVAGLPPLAAYNLLYFGQFAAAGVAAWWVLRRSRVSFLGSLLGGWFFAFGHFRWDEQSHFNVLLIAAIPIVLWTFDRVLAEPTAVRAAAFVAAYSIHLSGGTYLAYLVHVPMVVLLIQRRSDLWRRWRQEPCRRLPLVAAGTASALLLAAIYMAYASRVAGLGAERGLGELRQHSASLASFASVSFRSPLERAVPWLPRNDGHGALFAGFAATFCVAVALVSGWRRLRRPRIGRSSAWRAASVVGAALVAIGLVIADRFTTTGERSVVGLDWHGYRGPLAAVLVGAALVWVSERVLRGGALARWDEIDPWQRGLLASSGLALLLCLPVLYWLLWSVLPGMRGTRVSHRFFAFAALGLAFLVGKGFDRLRTSLDRRGARTALTCLMVVVFAAECAPRLRGWAPLAEEGAFPGYARRLAELDGVDAYLQLPIYSDWRDLRAMYFQTLHWRPLCNGSSSFLPRQYRELSATCKDLSAGCRDELRRRGVSHLVVVSDPDPTWPEALLGNDERLRRRAWRAVEEALAAGEIVPVAREASWGIFALTDGSAIASRVAERPRTARLGSPRTPRESPARRWPP
jgi:hypothetical protein